MMSRLIDKPNDSRSVILFYYLRFWSNLANGVPDKRGSVADTDDGQRATFGLFGPFQIW